MERIKQVKNPVLGVGQRVEVVFGQPIQMDDLLRRCYLTTACERRLPNSLRSSDLRVRCQSDAKARAELYRRYSQLSSVTRLCNESDLKS